MNDEIERVRDQLRRAIHGPAWHGPAVLAAAGEFDARRAWTRASPPTHHTAELLLHIAAWLQIVRRRFAGETVTPRPEEDWPAPPSPGDQAWGACIDGVRVAHAALDAALAAADDRRLSESVPGEELTQYVMLHGVVQHSIYHAGQLVLVRRALQ